MWSVSLKHYKCKEDWSGSYIIHDGRLRAGYARVATRQGVEGRKTIKNTLQYFEDEADYRLLLVSMQVSIIILILRAESPIIWWVAVQLHVHIVTKSVIALTWAPYRVNFFYLIKEASWN